MLTPLSPYDALSVVGIGLKDIYKVDRYPQDYCWIHDY